MPDPAENHVLEQINERLMRQVAGKLAMTVEAIDHMSKLVASALKNEQHRLAKAAREMAALSADARRDAGRLRRHLRA